jgi:hypothetical protein
MSGKLQRFIPCSQIEAVTCHRTPNETRHICRLISDLPAGTGRATPQHAQMVRTNSLKESSGMKNKFLLYQKFIQNRDKTTHEFDMVGDTIFKLFFFASKKHL